MQFFSDVKKIVKEVKISENPFITSSPIGKTM